MSKVIIIGAGPSGISMGAELVASGISTDDILIIEKSSHNNASIRQFYPVNKEINSVYKNLELNVRGIVGFSGLISLDTYYTMIQNIIETYQLNIKMNTEIQKVTKVEDSFVLDTVSGEQYKAEYVVLASGVFAKPRKPDYVIPIKLFSKVSYDIIPFQKNNWSGLDVLVVGGGDTASEYAQILATINHKVVMSYRQDNFFRMNDLNKDRLQLLEDKGKVQILFSTNITSLNEYAEKIKVNFNDREPIVVDRIVYSLGGSSPVAFMHNCGIEYDDTNVLLMEHKETAVNKLFMIGDLVTGRKGGSLMLAFNGAREVMEGLHAKYHFPKPKEVV